MESKGRKAGRKEGKKEIKRKRKEGRLLLKEGRMIEKKQQYERQRKKRVSYYKSVSN